MQPEKPALDPYSVQYYVVTPRDRARLTELLAPLPARETERLFKAILNDSFMANDMKKHNILDRIRFCAFRHALTIVRATPDGPSNWVNDQIDIKKHQQRLEKYVGLMCAYDTAFIEAILPLQKKHLEHVKGSQTSTGNLYRTICEMFASQLARHNAGIRHLSAADLKTLKDNLREYKTKLIKECYQSLRKDALPKPAPSAGVLSHLKPW